PDREHLLAGRRVLRAGDACDPEELASWLVVHGYRPTETVELPGEFSRRGGIVDADPPDADAPVRVRFFGHQIESLRPFSPQTQRSHGPQLAAELSAFVETAAGSDGELKPVPMTGNLCDYLAPGSWTVLVEVDDLTDQGKQFHERVPD